MEMIGSGRFRPHRVRPHIDSTSDQVLKFIFLLPRKNDNIVHAMKQNHTKHFYFSFFNPLKVADELEIENLGWVHGGELGGGELTMFLCLHNFLELWNHFLEFKKEIVLGIGCFCRHLFLKCRKD